MFNFLKSKKNIDFEITSNPDILFRKKISTSDIKIHGLKVLDSANNIIKVDILTTTFQKPPIDMLYFKDGGCRYTFKDNKVFYESNTGFKEYPLEERISSVLKFDGIFHMKTGAKFVVKNEVIIGMGIHNDILLPYKKIKKNEIESKFGRANKINEFYEDIDGSLFDTEYIYNERSMFIKYSDWDNEIAYINLHNLNL